MPYWNSNDLNHVIRERTKLYTSLGYTNQYLSVDDLPDQKSTIFEQILNIWVSICILYFKSIKCFFLWNKTKAKIFKPLGFLLCFIYSPVKKFVGKKWRIFALVTNIYYRRNFLPTKFFTDGFFTDKVFKIY